MLNSLMSECIFSVLKIIHWVIIVKLFPISCIGLREWMYDKCHYTFVLFAIINQYFQTSKNHRDPCLLYNIDDILNNNTIYIYILTPYVSSPQSICPGNR